MTKKVCQLFCDHCNWRLIARTQDDLKDVYEIKLDKIPGGIPKLNQQTKKTEIPEGVARTRKFRCPKCGFTIVSKMINDIQKEIEDKMQLEKDLAERNELERLSQGKK